MGTQERMVNWLSIRCTPIHTSKPSPDALKPRRPHDTRSSLCMLYTHHTSLCLSLWLVFGLRQGKG